MEIENKVKEEETVCGSLEHFLDNDLEHNLQDQRELVDEEQGQRYVGERLVEQRNMIAAVNEDRVKAEEAFIYNMIVIFQSMTLTQMQKLVHENEKVHMKLKLNNDSLQASKNSLENSAKRILEKENDSSGSYSGSAHKCFINIHGSISSSFVSFMRKTY